MPTPTAREEGFTLVEALIALTLIVTALAALAPLFEQSTTLMLDAREAPVVLAAAESKIEQLRTLAWTLAPDGRALSDLDTDTATDPPAPMGGTGLRLSPADSLDRSTEGFVDHLDAFGGSRGGGDTPPDETVYTRRWAIRAIDGDPDLLELRSCVWRHAALDGPASACLSTTRARRP